MTVRNNEGSIQSEMHDGGGGEGTRGSAELQVPAYHPLAAANLLVQLPRYWRFGAFPGTRLDIVTCILTHKLVDSSLEASVPA